MIPTFNGAARIENCLAAILPQAKQHGAEILVIDDGSTDRTAEKVAHHPGVRLIRQPNAGPAAARNRGASEATGKTILFTDDDCVPAPDWLKQMLKPFDDREVVGAKGVYRTRQESVIARFVQIEYEDRYRLMSTYRDIDFIDTYSAAFRRDLFVEMEGYDASFPVACAEDVELSYRMSARGWKMRFVPDAVVYHTHPDSLWAYLKKKYKFAFWRVLAVHKNPGKAIRDSHTPQLMKLQALFFPALLLSLAVDLAARPSVPLSAIVLGAFFASTVPFVLRAIKKDPIVAALSPVLLAARAAAQFLGVAGGVVHTWRKTAPISRGRNKSHSMKLKRN